QALLLVQRQLSVPALRPVERGQKVPEVHPLERSDHGSLVEVPELIGIAHSRTQRAEREIGPFRHKRHRLARRQAERPPTPGPHPRERPDSVLLPEAAWPRIWMRSPGLISTRRWSSVRQTSGSASCTSSSTSLS